MIFQWQMEEVILHARKLVPPAIRNSGNVQGVALLGSYARQEARAGSDLDLLLVHEGGGTLKRFFYFENTLVDLWISGVDHLKHLLTSGRSPVHVRMISEAAILEDPHGWVEEALAMAREARAQLDGSSPLDPEDPQVEEIQATLLHLIKKMGNKLGDPASCRFLSGVFSQRVVDAFYSLRGIPPVPFQKLFQDLDERDPRFSNQLRTFLGADGTDILSRAVDLTERALDRFPPLERVRSYRRPHSHSNKNEKPGESS